MASETLNFKDGREFRNELDKYLNAGVNSGSSLTKMLE